MIAAGCAMVAVLAAAIRGRPTNGRTARTPFGHARRRRRPRPDWASFVDMVASQVRAGNSLRTALDAALAHHTPDGQALRHGVTLDDIGTARTTDPDEAVVVRALATAVQLGGPVATGLHSAAALLRQRSATRADALAHSAQARLSARVLTAVPLAFWAWSALASRSFRATLFTGSGAMVTALGAACNLGGWWWMRRTIERAAP